MRRTTSLTLTALVVCSLGLPDAVAGHLNKETKLTASDGAAFDFFGVSLSVDADTIVVGAFRDDDKGSSSGSAYVFRRSLTGWVEEQKLIAGDGVRRDEFGVSVSVDMDTIVVGAFRDDDKGSSSGSAYVFRRGLTGWVEEQKLTASDGVVFAFFGRSVSVDADTIVVGALADRDKGFDSGSAYVFESNVFESNQPPMADAGADTLAECTSPAGALMALDGSASTDADSTPGTNDDIVLFEWFENFGTSYPILLGTGETLDVPLTLSSHVITLRVTDSFGDTDTDQAQITVQDTAPPMLRHLVEVVPEYRGKFGRDDAVFRSLGVQVIDQCDQNPLAGAVAMNGSGVQPGDLLRLKLNKEARIKESDGEFTMRMEAPQFIFSATAVDSSGNETTFEAAIHLEDLAGSELEVDEVVPGTERRRGVPISGDAQEEFEEHVKDLVEDGFLNPPGLSSSLATE